MQSIGRSKFKELPESVLVTRKLKKTPLGAEYIVRDLIGSERVECIMTTSGRVLRKK